GRTRFRGAARSRRARLDTSASQVYCAVGIAYRSSKQCARDRGPNERGATPMKDALKATLRDLSTLHGVSGVEQPLVGYVRKRVTGLVDEVQVDRYGNVTAIKRGRQERPRLMLAAHLDEIGFIVKAIDEQGFLRFDRIGGMGDGILPCRRVSVKGHFGIIGA